MRSEKRKQQDRAYYLRNKERILAQGRVYRSSHQEQYREYCREWQRKNPERAKSNHANWRKNNKAKVVGYVKRWQSRNKERVTQSRRRWYINLRLEVLTQYGNKCQCCGETEQRFLIIDHVNKDGAVHRQKVGRRIYQDLKRRGFPKDGYRVLCWNCNTAIAYSQTCPHQHGN